MQINCRYCAAEIPVANINLDNMLAKCSNCNAVYSISGELGVDQPQKRKLESVDMPAAITVNEDFEGLTINRRWIGSSAYSLLFFGVIWNGFMVVWFGAAFTSGALPMVLCGSLHAAVGIFLAYYRVAKFINTTTIKVNHEVVTVRYAPLPWSGEKSLLTNHIAQLFCKEKISRSSKGSTTITYEVYAIRSDQNRDLLVSEIDNPQQAFFIEQEIERYLRIENRPVGDEMDRY